MTHIYFIRHAQSDRTFQQEQSRPLTAEGVSDSKKITEVLKDKGITHILSSPYKRTLQTVESLSEALEINIEIDEDLKERDAGKWHGDRFFDYVKQQWENFDYASESGESLRQVQCRNINAVNRALEKYKNKTIAIATHGTALSTILNYYFSDYGYEEFLKIADLMPLVIKLTFDSEKRCIEGERIFSEYKKY